jgi:hypothetical protein
MLLQPHNLVPQLTTCCRYPNLSLNLPRSRFRTCARAYSRTCIRTRNRTRIRTCIRTCTHLRTCPTTPRRALDARLRTTRRVITHHHFPLMTKQSATSSAEKSKNELAIWSRRPTDPSAAPAIIISPRARPPPRVIDDALNLPTPPLTPIQVAVNIPEDPDRDKGTETPDEPPTVQTQTLDSSSPVTETTAATPSVHDTTTPASPISSRTSISNTSPSEVKSPSTPSTAVPAEYLPWLNLRKMKLRKSRSHLLPLRFLLLLL